MDADYPYFPSHYSTTDKPCSSSRQDMTAVQMSTKKDILLNTEPQDLDKLFNRGSFQQNVEQDICFPSSSNSRPSISSTLDGNNEEARRDYLPVHQKQYKPQHMMRQSISSYYEGIDLNALSLLLVDQPPLSHGYNNKANEKQDTKKRLLSLYGDNHRDHAVERYLQQPVPQIEAGTPSANRFMYYHPDTGCIQGSSLTELNLPPGTTLEALLIKENYWMDITSPSNEEMKAISKVSK
jgi:hypothetical protein